MKPNSIFAPNQKTLHLKIYSQVKPSRVGEHALILPFNMQNVVNLCLIVDKNARIMKRTEHLH